jgi:hypothetical protein
MARPRAVVLVIALVLLGLLGIPVAQATPPAESGVVERGEAPWWWWEFDVESGLAAVFNLDLGAFCDDANEPDSNVGWTDLPAGIGFLDRQDVFAPPLGDTEIEDLASFLGKLRGDAVPTTVWEIDESFFEFLDFIFALPQDPSSDLLFWGAFCEWFGGEALATGTTKVVFNDNDVLADISNNKRSNAWGFTANGKLTKTDGSVRPFHTVVKLVWSGDVTVERFNAVIKVQLN